MSIKKIKESITNFLIDPNPGIISINGVWGSGKTYCWEKTLSNGIKNTYKFKKYSYVSLFGINSIEDFKFNICSASIDKTQIGKKLSLENILNPNEFSWKRFTDKGVSTYAKFFSGKYGDAVKALVFNYLEDTLICIDDLDRKGDDLNINEVLGILSNLKELRNCKIAIIFNDMPFKEQEKSDYDALREKVIDLEIPFCPDIEEVLDIAFNKNMEKETELRKMLEPHIIKLKIKNIRILIRIKSFCQDLLVELGENNNDKLIYQAISTSVLFVWCFYSKNENAPDYQFVKSYSMYRGLLSSKDEDVDKERNKEQEDWSDLLDSYGFTNCDEFDLELALAIEKKYFDKRRIVEIATLLNIQFENGQSREAFFKVWENFRSTFQENKTDFTGKLIKSFKENIGALSVSDLHGTVSTLKELNMGETANDLIDQYIKMNEKKNIFNLAAYPFRGDIKDKVIIQKFNQKFLETKEKLDLRNVLIEMSKGGGWGKEESDKIASSTEKDLYSVFMNHGDGELKEMINLCLGLQSRSPNNKNYKNVHGNTIKALKQICQENPLNKIKLKFFGIKLDNQDSQ